VRHVIVALLTISLFFGSASTYAAWLDDWYQDATIDSPKYYKGHERGYFSAGGFAYKTRPRTDYLMTVNPPRIRAGCGGVDILLGGFGFLSGKLLMEKLQRILSAAPVAAFDIALNTLCEPCSKAIKSMSAIADMLNSMQLNDCLASKAAVSTVMKAGFDAFGMEAQGKKMESVQSEFMQKSGLSDLWSTISNKTAKDDGKPQIDLKEALQACDQSIVDVFGTSGSILEHIAKKMGVSDSAMIDIMRGYTGDVMVRVLEKEVVADYRDPCAQNNLSNAESLVRGPFYKMDSTGTCTPYTGKNLNQIILEKMERISAAMKDRQRLSQADEDFLRASPLNIGLNLMTALRQGQDGPVIASLAEMTAFILADTILTDLIRQSRIMTEKIERLAALKTSETNTCDPHLIARTLLAVGKLQKSTEKTSVTLHAAYTGKLGEYRTLLSLMESHRLFHELQGKTITSRFGAAMAQRVM
jgi:conjugative transfer pilus assembly protein TraH